MDFEYLCPKCRGHLCVENQIIFTTKTKDWSGGLILMHPEPGNYHFTNHPSFKFEEGRQIDFYCPICAKKLTSKHHDNLAKIIMKDKEDNEYIILFSRKAGEKSTYKIIGESMEYYGKDANSYFDYLNLDHMY